MNPWKLLKILHPESQEEICLFNSRLGVLPVRIHNLQLPEIETIHAMYSIYLKKPSLELFEAILYADDWIGLSYRERTDSRVFKPDRDCINTEKRMRRAMLRDALTYFSAELPESFSDITKEQPSSSAYIAEGMDIVRQKKSIINTKNQVKALAARRAKAKRLNKKGNLNRSKKKRRKSCKKKN